MTSLSASDPYKVPPGRLRGLLAPSKDRPGIRDVWAVISSYLPPEDHERLYASATTGEHASRITSRQLALRHAEGVMGSLEDSPYSRYDFGLLLGAPAVYINQERRGLPMHPIQVKQVSRVLYSSPNPASSQSPDGRWICLYFQAEGIIEIFDASLMKKSDKPKYRLTTVCNSGAATAAAASSTVPRELTVEDGPLPNISNLIFSQGGSYVCAIGSCDSRRLDAAKHRQRIHFWNLTTIDPTKEEATPPDWSLPVIIDTAGSNALEVKAAAFTQDSQFLLIKRNQDLTLLQLSEDSLPKLLARHNTPCLASNDVPCSLIATKKKRADVIITYSTEPVSATDKRHVLRMHTLTAQPDDVGWRCALSDPLELPDNYFPLGEMCADERWGYMLLGNSVEGSDSLSHVNIAIWDRQSSLPEKPYIRRLDLVSEEGTPSPFLTLAGRQLAVSAPADDWTDRRMGHKIIIFHLTNSDEARAVLQEKGRIKTLYSRDRIHPLMGNDQTGSYVLADTHLYRLRALEDRVLEAVKEYGFTCEDDRVLGEGDLGLWIPRALFSGKDGRINLARRLIAPNSPFARCMEARQLQGLETLPLIDKTMVDLSKEVADYDAPVADYNSTRDRLRRATPIIASAAGVALIAYSVYTVMGCVSEILSLNPGIQEKDSYCYPFFEGTKLHINLISNLLRAVSDVTSRYKPDMSIYTNLLLC